MKIKSVTIEIEDDENVTINLPSGKGLHVSKTGIIYDNGESEEFGYEFKKKLKLSPPLA